MGMGGVGGGVNQMRDPMRNAALSAQFIDGERKRDNSNVSDKQRKIAIAACGVLAAFIVGIISLFFIL